MGFSVMLLRSPAPPLSGVRDNSTQKDPTFVVIPPSCKRSLMLPSRFPGSD